MKIKSILYSQENDDITSCIQDTFIKAWENRKYLKKHENIAGWLIITAKNIAGNFNKKHNIHQKVILVSTDIEDIADETDFAQEIVEIVEFEKYLKSNIIEKFINRLSKSERLLYELKFRQKHSNEDIGRILGITANAVASRNKRLLQKFKKDFLSTKK